MVVHCIHQKTLGALKGGPTIYSDISSFAMQPLPRKRTRQGAPSRGYPALGFVNCLTPNAPPADTSKLPSFSEDILITPV
ncbi:hypothetical protein JTE90_023163 [Oedothorax gibbosus]|uniref:Uncharacterized protein n=1 Tax=Oedothorax gibbosus TaxID=931172 RepID=A0AAV6URU2_9ARAC|nr:hypothetical protein JTE90_023163 [Oedothorax gibbosus]